MRLRQENEGEDEAERVFLALVGNNILQPSSRWTETNKKSRGCELCGIRGDDEERLVHL